MGRTRHVTRKEGLGTDSDKQCCRGACWPGQWWVKAVLGCCRSLSAQPAALTTY